MALARAELTGPSLSRLRPKLQETALALWTIYIILTGLEIILLWSVGGMTMFDAFNHGLTTMPFLHLKHVKVASVQALLFPYLRAIELMIAKLESLWVER